MRTTDTDQRFTRRQVRAERRDAGDAKDNRRTNARGTRVRQAQRLEAQLARAGVTQS